MFTSCFAHTLTSIQRKLAQTWLVKCCLDYNQKSECLNGSKNKFCHLHRNSAHICWTLYIEIKTHLNEKKQKHIGILAFNKCSETVLKIIHYNIGQILLVIGFLIQTESLDRCLMCLSWYSLIYKHTRPFMHHGGLMYTNMLSYVSHCVRKNKNLMKHNRIIFMCI